jgi:hypothetical protein
MPSSNEGKNTSHEELHCPEKLFHGDEIHDAQRTLHIQASTDREACLQKRDGKGELSVVLVDDTEQRKNIVQPREADKPDQHGNLDREIAISKPNMHGTAGDVCTVVNTKPPSETPPPAALGKERLVHQKEPKKYKRQNVKRTERVQVHTTPIDKKRQLEGDTMEIDGRNKKSKTDVIITDVNNANAIVNAGLLGQLRGAQ